MSDYQIIEKAIEEVDKRTLGITNQFLQIHDLVYHDNKPKIARVDVEKENIAIVYFNVANEEFFLAVIINTKPNILATWAYIEPFHSVYFRASSEILSLQELSKLTNLQSTRGRNKGDKRRPDTESEILFKFSTIDFEPNPEADEFEDKLNKLLNFLEQDKEGIRNLVGKAYSRIHVYSSFHNGNTKIGGHHITKDHIKRMGNLNLAIDFDISADGNFFM